MCERLSAHISVPIYPLAPEHDFHAIYDMVSKVYSEVVDGSRPVAIMGDSAGGNMALVLTMMAARQGLPVADRLVLISPTVDATLSDPRTAELARLDPWLDLPGGREAVRIYAADLAASDWRISPGLGDLTVLPPTQVFSGTRDLLHADTVTFADKAKAAGVDVELVVGKGMIHVWPLIDMPEAHRARDAMAAFLLAGAPFEATPRPPSPASPW
jgi:acetyl esterase/lipase